MKKFIVSLLVALTCSLVHGFGNVPWTCTDLAEAQAIVEANPGVSRHQKMKNAFIVGYLTNPSAYDTADKLIALYKSIYVGAKDQQSFDSSFMLALMQRANCINGFMQHQLFATAGNPRVRLATDLYITAGIPLTAQQRCENIRVGLTNYLATHLNKPQPAIVYNAVSIYARICSIEEDAVVIAFAKGVYKRVVPMIADSDDWKKSAVTLGLILKAYGVKVE